MAKYYAWKLIVAVALAATLVVPGVSATSMVFQSPPPPNDNFGSATVVTTLPFSDPVDMTYATTENNEPQYCNGTQKTVWYSYTPATTQAMRVTLSGFYDTNLVIYRADGPNLADLSEINCASWYSLSLTFNALAGRTYYFQVGSIYGSTGVAQLAVETVPPPANDNFASAAEISGTYYSQSVDITGATSETGEPTGNCGYTPQHTIWYKFTAPANGLVNTSLWGADTILYAYREDGSGFEGLSPSLGCASYGGGLGLTVQANMTYYFQAGTIWSQLNTLNFTLSFTPAPPNDNFANAMIITALPYDLSTDLTAASREANEPSPTCGYTSKTIWFAYTPTTNVSLSQRTDTWSSTVVGVYTGSSEDALTEVACRSRNYYDSSFLTFHVNAGTTYYFQVGASESTWVPFHLQVAEPPYPNFAFYPYDPNVFDNVYFENYSWDPANAGISSIAWDFGDGTTATEPWSLNHRYAKDGDYTVRLTVSTPDGRTASTSRTVSVKTHDVAITKFTVPQSASAGQTRQIVVGLNSKRYVEDVEVQLYKSTPNGWQWVGTLRQTVPVRPSNRTTDFLFSYSFTKDDAAIGKVTFRAVATIINARDALPADNEAIGSPPTKVNK